METPVSNDQVANVANESILCPQCQRHALVARHCKVLCQACGYVESCEDNFPTPPEA